MTKKKGILKVIRRNNMLINSKKKSGLQHYRPPNGRLLKVVIKNSEESCFREKDEIIK